MDEDFFRRKFFQHEELIKSLGLELQQVKAKLRELENRKV